MVKSVITCFSRLFSSSCFKTKSGHTAIPLPLTAQSLATLALFTIRFLDGAKVPEMATHHHFFASSQTRKSARLGTFASGSRVKMTIHIRYSSKMAGFYPHSEARELIRTFPNINGS